MSREANLVRNVLEDIRNAEENGYNVIEDGDDEAVALDLIESTSGYEGQDLSIETLIDAVRQVREFREYERKMRISDSGITRMYFKEPGVCLIVKRLMFHWTMLVSDIGNYEVCSDRWCYATQTGPLGAQDAAERWIREGTEEPTMWHRHHKTSRRRPQGDASKEYIED